MSSKTKTKSKRNSPKTSGKTKDGGRGRKHPAKIEEGSSTLLDFGAAVASGVKEDDIKHIISIQNKSLKSFTKTNELLGKFNDFSSSKYDVLQHMFVQHTRLLVELKKDLTNIFLRIRNLKVQLQKQHPGAFEATFNLRKDLEERLESELLSEATYIDKTEQHNERKNETKSLLNEGQVLPLKLAEKKESEKSSTASITENMEQTREDDHVLPRQQCSLKNVGNNHVESKCQELDATVMVMTESLEIVKENEVEVPVTEENQAKIGEADIDLVKDDYKQERAEDKPEQTKGNLNETKEEVEEIKDNLEMIEDNPGQTKGNETKKNETKKEVEEFQESDNNPKQTKGNLDGSEDNMGRSEDNVGGSKDNLRKSEDLDNLEQNKDDL